MKQDPKNCLDPDRKHRFKNDDMRLVPVNFERNTGYNPDPSGKTGEAVAQGFAYPIGP